ncbi:MAG TPA: hypothetical protein VMW73_15230 [Spirochaetia bacterium]|nr:hypothetical protein [Spirochaetia bacterium]
MNEPLITKRIKDDDAFFTVQWSTLKRAEKFEILASVPSVSGIVELYFEDSNHTLNYIDMYRAWYGGLRNVLRELVDPTIAREAGLRELAKRRVLVYRYSMSNSHADISDVLYFFANVRKRQPVQTGAPGVPRDSSPTEPSGRFRYIYVNEESPDKLVTI